MASDAMDAIVLVGGKGTRLLTVVNDRPKPMAPVAGRPFLEWLLLFLRGQGIRRVILATGYKGEMVEAHFRDGTGLGLQVVYSHEEIPLGTGGAVRHALPQVTTDPVLVLNGDSFCPFDVEHLLGAKCSTGAQALLWLVWTADCRRYGSVALAEGTKVVAFHEKASDLRAGRINAGVYLLRRHVLESIPATRPVSLETEVFPSLIGHGLYATAGPGPFLDIGTPESYRKAGSFFAENSTLRHRLEGLIAMDENMVTHASAR